MVLGADGESVTDAVGAESTIVTVPARNGALAAEPSFAVTSSAIASPRSPLPSCDRSRPADWAPKSGAAFFSHW